MERIGDEGSSRRLIGVAVRSVDELGSNHHPIPVTVEGGAQSFVTHIRVGEDQVENHEPRPGVGQTVQQPRVDLP